MYIIHCVYKICKDTEIKLNYKFMDIKKKFGSYCFPLFSLFHPFLLRILKLFMEKESIKESNCQCLCINTSACRCIYLSVNLHVYPGYVTVFIYLSLVYIYVCNMIQL